MSVLHQARARNTLRQAWGWFEGPVLQYCKAMKPVPHFLVVSAWVGSLCLVGGSVLAPSGALAHGVLKTPAGTSLHHTARSRSTQAKICYRIASGVIVLEQMPNSGRRLGRGSGFAPVGEAVFRSSNRLHACPGAHGRRG
ncbi:hypothetical protein [Gluconobacter sphaericus]|uniref:hypothetical protein n=1 Tax=Gluconobacter sphaericus TaxID=574987 RepID=UPI00201166DE|nr:hypothetical protein [Gluconobacter sphaericus]